MWIGRVLVLIALIVIQFVCTQDAPESTTHTFEDVSTTESSTLEVEEKISSYILKALEHFKAPDPVGLPWGQVQDPYPVPDMTKTMTFGTLYFENTAVHGISKFRILYIDTDVKNMTVHAGLLIEHAQARGNYTHCTFMCFNRVQGPFTVDVTGLNVTGYATLGVERSGRLRAQDIQMDMNFETIKLNFQNLDFLGQVLQGLMNTLSDYIFNTIKPNILKDFHKKIRDGINEKLQDVTGDIEFPNTLTPLDMIIVDVRNSIRERGADPYKLEDYSSDTGLMYIGLTNTWLFGVSSIYRTGNITTTFKNATVIVDFDVGTRELKGSTNWWIATAGGLIRASGSTSFSIEHIQARVVIAQPLDTRRKLKLETLDLDVGNIQARCDGAGTMDYVVELAVNVLPNLIRYQILDLMGGQLKVVMQEKLQMVDMEEVIKQELPRLDAMQEAGFKLSMLREPINKRHDEDDFFNF